MRLLLGTHTVLWFLLNNSQLSSNARSHIVDPDNDLLVSPASYWELAIKMSLGKYKLQIDFATFLETQLAANAIDVLPITIRHAAVVAKLPHHHRDPFDRMLVGQAIVEQVPIVSADAQLDRYEVRRIW